MHEILKCDLCGKVATILHDGGRRTICCEQIMKKLAEQGEGEGDDSHVPVIRKTRTGIRVAVGHMADPMDDDHYLEWIEVTADGSRMVQELGPGQSPEAGFPLRDPDVKARALCNRHGLWSNKPSPVP